jgi:hypothetical protein
MSPADIRTTFFTGQPFTATSPSGTKFKMTFTPDGKITRQPCRAIRNHERWHMEAEHQGVLHRLGSRRAQLLHSRSERRKQMVGTKNRNDHRNNRRCLVEIALGAAPAQSTKTVLARRYFRFDIGRYSRKAAPV